MLAIVLSALAITIGLLAAVLATTVLATLATTLLLLARLVLTAAALLLATLTWTRIVLLLLVRVSHSLSPRGLISPGRVNWRT
jgi:hypothetical protein